ncbi:Zn-dependent exopeptidase [Venturia nashicola]|uniref:Zn-dependent exopeptidase n=1 Tax=Venturia nashicola TaxID=86259 RepID=A0A4Z1PF97_9PEZI|nr:Zn-dependent exopeptidase [Venturia nashicola]
MIAWMRLLLTFSSLLHPTCASQAQAPPLQRSITPQQTRLSPQNLPATTSNGLLSLHRKLVEIESTSGNEKPVGEWLKGYLEDKNLTVELQEVEKGRYNVFAYPGKERKTKVLVSSHIDTVPPYWPYERKTANGVDEIWGRGSVDAKACVAAQIVAVLDLLESESYHLPSDALSLLFVVAEEVGGDGMRYFSDRKPTNYSAIVFGEPTEGKLVAGHKGMLGLTLNITGKAAHSGYPWLGISANNVLVQALSTVLALERDDLPGSKKFGKTTVNIGRVSGGLAANVVAESSKAEIAIRIAGGSPEEINMIITKALQPLKEETENAGGIFELQWSKRAYGTVDIDTDVKGFDTVTVNYGTDIPNIEGDHKRYLYGPGSIFVAHSDHEHLAVSELEQSVLDFQKIILAQF